MSIHTDGKSDNRQVEKPHKKKWCKPEFSIIDAGITESGSSSGAETAAAYNRS